VREVVSKSSVSLSMNELYVAITRGCRSRAYSLPAGLFVA